MAGMLILSGGTELADIRRIPTPHSYSRAVDTGDFVFLGLHRGKGDNFAAQLNDVFNRMKETLEELDLALADIVKINVWLKNIKDLPEMEKHVRDYFEPNAFPARMTSTTEFIDGDCLLMMDGVAYRSKR